MSADLENVDVLEEDPSSAQQQKKQQKQKVVLDIRTLPVPDYVPLRIKKWEEIKKRREAQLADKKGKPIKISLPDGKVIDGASFQTTPFDVARSISKSLAEQSIVARIDGTTLWDLGRPLESDCKLELLDFNTNEGKHVFWHSSSHVLGQALERFYNCKLCSGPPVKEGEGFFYDAFMGDKFIAADDFETLDSLVSKVIKEKQPFERLVLTKEEALDLFDYNEFKIETLTSKVAEGGFCTAYRCGDLIDPCKGPHLLDTGRVRSFLIVKNSSAYWHGDSTKPSLQRLYGVSFPEKEQLSQWKKVQEEAAKRDHRLIGKNQELWTWKELSPGSTFFLPHGARIYSTLLQFIKREFRKRGFDEVITPNIFDSKLWKISGHWENYGEHMFTFKCEGADYGLKPMNCPAHCVMFGNRKRSYRELPIRFADVGALHRNEFSGALSGMTRVRRFQQDDAHIFCTEDQVATEIRNALIFVRDVYSIFGFQFYLKLSTRPAKYLGEIETWDKAEKSLETALNDFGQAWEFNPGDGAFYGPKIDITMEDALKRKHQCATVQLDFQLPQRFDLTYEAGNGEQKRPVIIHRAVFGSFERFIAIVTENYAGKWPFWLSPRQCIVVPVSQKHDDYAKKIHAQLFDAGYHADVDLTDNKVPKKVRNAQLAQYNFILVVGDEEVNANTVNVRTRDNQVHGAKTVEELLSWLKQLVAEFK